MAGKDTPKIVEIEDEDTPTLDEFYDCESDVDADDDVPLRFKQSVLKNITDFEKQLLQSTELDPSEVFEVKVHQENEGDTSAFSSRDLHMQMDQLVLELPDEDDEEENKLKKLAAKMTPLTGAPGIYKRLCKAGDGTTPPDDSIVTIHYNGFIQDEINGEVKSFDSSVLRGKPKTFMKGQNEVLPGMDVAVGSMKRNEQSEFIFTPDWAFGERGCPPRIPPNAYVYFIIDLLDWVDSSAAEAFCKLPKNKQKEVPFLQVLEAAKSEKNKATSFFEKQNFIAALKCYRNALVWIQDHGYANEEEEEQGQKLCLKLHLDLAICYLKVNKPKGTCIHCRDALEIDPHNAKAFFRFGLAKEKLGDFNAARQWLEKARKICPKDTSINRAIMDLNAKVRKEDYIEKDLYRKMLGVTVSPEAKPTSPSEESHSSIRKQLKEFVEDSCESSLVFPDGLTSQERAFIESEASRLNLKFSVKPQLKGEGLCAVSK